MGTDTGFMEYDRSDPGYRPVEERLRDYRDVALHLSDEDIGVQATRCMDCGIPFCHGYGCPVTNMIPEFNDNVSRGRWEEALNILLATNPFPEFTGRMPVLATLQALDQEALVTILTEPRGALVRQFQRLFAMDGLRLRFTDGALQAIARECLDEGTGARGLRAALERVLQEPMFELPSRDDVEDVWITEDVVAGRAPALLRLRSETG